MRRASSIGIAVVIAIAIAMTAMTWLRPSSEPTFQGRPLSSWLRQATAPARHSKSVLAAQSAVRAIGAEKSDPVLFKLASADSGKKTFNDWFMELVNGFNLNVPTAFESNDPGIMAIAGFQILGTNAAGAVPALTTLLQNPEHSMEALQCLTAIGPPARDAVSSALKGGDSQIRAMAVWDLLDVFDDKGAFWKAIEPCLSDADPNVRSTAIQVVGNQTKAADKAVPLLMTVLRRGDTNDTLPALIQFQNFGTNAAPAFEMLSNIANTTPRTIAGVTALRTMTQTAPERTLPILSHRLHSVDPSFRAQALLILVREYPKPEQAVIAAEYAAQDPDEFIATRAVNFLERVKAETANSH